MMRVLCWDALERDNPDELHTAIQQFCDRYNMEHSILFEQLETRMWKSEMGKWSWDTGTHENYGLVPIAAANISGVPSDGAIRCLEYLLTEYNGMWSQHQLEVALEGANRLSRTRAVELIESYNAI